MVLGLNGFIKTFVWLIVSAETVSRTFGSLVGEKLDLFIVENESVKSDDGGDTNGNEWLEFSCGNGGSSIGYGGITSWT